MRRVFALAVTVLLTLPNAAAARPRQRDHAPAYLLSLTGWLGALHGDGILDFNVQLQNLKVLAICRIPRGWTMTAGATDSEDMPTDPDVTLAGKVVFLDHGANILASHEMKAKGPLLLIVLERSGGRSARVSLGALRGKATVMNFDDRQDRTTPLTSTNISLTPARACPPLPASRLAPRASRLR